MPLNLSQQHTVSPNRVTKYGWTALEIAAINGFDDIISLLVTQYGGDVNQENPNNHATPLENAIEGGHLDTVRVMMEELEVPARFRGAEVADLKSAEAVVISQGEKQCWPISGLDQANHVSGELINPGDDHKEIIFYLQQRNNLPKHIENRITFRMSMKR